jgi:hypothetical protein
MSSEDEGRRFAQAFERWPDISLEEISTIVSDCARGVFLTDKRHVPMFFMATQKDAAGDAIRGIGLLDAGKYMGNNKEKDKLARLLRRLVAKYDADMVIMVTEAWMHKGVTKEEAEESFKQGKTSPNRVEALVVSGTTKDGKVCMIVSPILRNGETVALDTADVTNAEVGSKIDGRFMNYWAD